MSAAYTKTSTATDDFAPARDVFETMARHLESPSGLGMTHSELEDYVVREGRELQRRMLQGHLDLRARAEAVVNVVNGSGVRLSRARSTKYRLVSVVGQVAMSRLLYQAAGMDGLSPLDASLNVPCESFSLGVRRRVAEQVASASFDHAVERLSATTGADVAERQVEELAQRAAADFPRANDDFDAYWQHHLNAEYERNHASRYAGHRVPNPLAAGRHLRRVK